MGLLQKTIRQPAVNIGASEKPSFWITVKKDFRRNRYIYLMLLPVILYYLIFHYGPMYGAIIAFQDYVPAKGVFGSEWVGFENFNNFFNSFFFVRLIRNTLSINLLDLFFGFPAPIILALLLNEIRWEPFKRMVQTISYMPHFISVVVIVGILIDFFARDGLVNQILASVLPEPIPFLQMPEMFQPLFVGSGIWQHMGWASIVFLAAITAIDPSLYEAAMVDGAGRFRQLIHITLPGIMPTIMVLLILRLGAMMTIGYEKIILMYSPATYETADVISTYVYRRGILNTDYSFSAAVGLFNSVINFGLVVLANTISRKINNTSLW